MNWLKPYLSPRVAPLLILGMSSGLPLALSGGTLQAWATVAHVSLKEIGFITLVSTAYTFKFLWAPLLDRYVPPWMGRRRGWIAIAQIILGLLIIAMGLLNPATELVSLAILATAVAFMSATQDIAFDAYSTEILREDETAAGAAIRVLGYRIGMIISSGLAMVIASEWLGWGSMYILMGLIMIGFTLMTFFSPEPDNNKISPPRSLEKAFTQPFLEFFSRKGALTILALIVLYKLGDAFAGALSTTFLIRGAGFTPTEVGTVNKILAIVMTIMGALAGGSIMSKLGLYRSLMIFGILQGFSNFAYWIVAMLPQHLSVMIIAIGVENLCAGMGTAAFVAFLMLLCNRQFTATQFALLTALSSIGRVFAGPISGFLIQDYHLSWANFYLLTIVISLPGLLLLWLQRHHIKQLVLVNP